MIFKSLYKKILYIVLLLITLYILFYITDITSFLFSTVSAMEMNDLSNNNTLTISHDLIQNGTSSRDIVIEIEDNHELALEHSEGIDVERDLEQYGYLVNLSVFFILGVVFIIVIQ